MFDKLHQECGLFRVLGPPDAADLVYLGFMHVAIAGTRVRGSRPCRPTRKILAAGTYG